MVLSSWVGGSTASCFKKRRLSPLSTMTWAPGFEASRILKSSPKRCTEWAPTKVMSNTPLNFFLPVEPECDVVKLEAGPGPSMSLTVFRAGQGPPDSVVPHSTCEVLLQISSCKEHLDLLTLFPHHRIEELFCLALLCLSPSTMVTASVRDQR